MNTLSEVQPNRRFVQTPTIVAVRLGIFGLLIIAAIYGVLSGSTLGLILGGAGLILLAVGLALTIYVLRRPTRDPQPRPEVDRGVGAQPETSFAAVPAEISQQMRVYPIQTGVTLVSFGQFFKGNQGWVGARAIWNMGADEATVFWAPVHVYLIIHPTYGPILVDAGLSRAQMEKGYYSPRKGGFTGMVWKSEDNYIPAEMELSAQLAKLRFQPQDIRHVIMTHLHEDHVGELNRFAHATVHISGVEWDDRQRMGYAPSYAAITNWDIFDFDSGCFHAFDASKDLFGDGSIILVPTYGHAAGHTSLFIQMGDYALCLAADALYTLRHLNPESLAAFNYFGRVGFETQSDSARRLAAMQKALPDLIYIPTHDPFDYTFKLAQPFLADGMLSPQERQQLQAYQDNLYDASGKLKPEAQPRFEKIRPDLGRVIADLP